MSYALSRLRFKMRKPMMNIALILGMFPGFMSMVAIYYILKGLGLTENPLVCLTLVYICGSGLTYYIAKGFFDTIPKSLDESAYLDGATRSQVFFRITIPLSKPIIVYTVLKMCIRDRPLTVRMSGANRSCFSLTVTECLPSLRDSLRTHSLRTGSCGEIPSMTGTE